MKRAMMSLVTLLALVLSLAARANYLRANDPPGIQGTEEPQGGHGREGPLGLATTLRIIDVKDAPYNATGDGTTDDTTALQRALDTACAGTPQHPSVYIPTGRYNTDRPLRLACGKIEIYGNGIASAIGGTVKRFAGPGIIISPINSQKLYYAPALVGTGNALYTTGCSGTKCGWLVLTDILGPFVTNKLNGLSQFDVEFFFKATATGGGGQLIGGTVDLPDSDRTPSFNIGSTAENKLTAGMTIDDVWHFFTARDALKLGNIYEVELSYDGNTIRLFVNGALEGSASASGPVTQDPFEQIQLPGGCPGNWPDQGDTSCGTWKGVIDSIRFLKVADHTAPYKPIFRKFDATANNTLLLVNFDTSPDGSQIARYGPPPNSSPIYLPIRGESYPQLSEIHMHDLAFNQSLIAIWCPNSIWENISISNWGGALTTQIPNFDFFNNDFYGTTRDLRAWEGPIGFVFGGAYNTSVNIADFADQSISAVGMIAYGGGEVDVQPRMSVGGANYWPFIFRNYQEELLWPFTDVEQGDPNYRGAIYINTAGGMTVSEGQLSTIGKKPVIDIIKAYGSVSIIDSSLSGGSPGTTVVHVSGGDPKIYLRNDTYSDSNILTDATKNVITLSGDYYSGLPKFSAGIDVPSGSIRAGEPTLGNEQWQRTGDWTYVPHGDTSLTFPKPPNGTKNGDILFMCVAIINAANMSISCPGGMDQKAFATDNANIAIAACAKTANNETGPYQPRWVNGGIASVILQDWKNVASVGAGAANAGPNGTEFTSTAARGTGAGDVIATCAQSAPVLRLPAGETLAYNANIWNGLASGQMLGYYQGPSVDQVWHTTARHGVGDKPWAGLQVPLRGNAVAISTPGSVSGANLNADVPQVPVKGTTSGKFTCVEPFEGVSYKKVICHLDGYENSTTTAQEWTYPKKFSVAMTQSTSMSPMPRASVTKIIFPTNMSAPITGLLIVEGY